MKANLNYFQESSVYKKELTVRVMVTFCKDFGFLEWYDTGLHWKFPRHMLEVRVRFPFL